MLDKPNKILKDARYLHQDL